MKLEGSFRRARRRWRGYFYGKAMVDDIPVGLTISAAACNVITVKAYPLRWLILRQ